MFMSKWMMLMLWWTICTNAYHLGPIEKGCGINEHWANSGCCCLSGYVRIEKVCTRCPEGTTYDPHLDICEPLCDQNAYYSSGRCFCKDDYQLVGRKCDKCPVGTAYNPATYSCIPQCPYYEVYGKDGCVCQAGYNRVNGKCIECPKDTNYDPFLQKCLCLKDLIWSDKYHKCVIDCGVHSYFDGGICVCEECYYYINGVCGQCPQNSTYVSYRQDCMCGYGYKFQHGKCKAVCTSRQYYDEDKNVCVNYCEQETEVWIKGKCYCAEGFIRQKNGICFPECGPFQERINGKCRCIDNYYKGVDGRCVKISCPPGHKWDKKRRECRSLCPGVNEELYDGYCVCVRGYEREDTAGLCMPDCPRGQMRKNGVCSCPGHNSVVDGSCTHCPRYTQYVKGICLCYNGQPPINGHCQRLSCPDRNQVYDPYARVCKCRRPLIWMNNECQYMENCLQNQYWNGDRCECKYGYVMRYGKCEKVNKQDLFCPYNSKFNGVNCACVVGTYPISAGVCAPCPVQHQWNGVRCELVVFGCAVGFEWSYVLDKCVPENYCNEDQYWDGIGCRCKQGFFWIQDECRTCNYGEYFDGVDCVQMQMPTCDDPYMFWNGDACVCIDGYHQLEDICVKCPWYTYWNGIVCVPKPGYEIDPLVPCY